MSMLIDPYRFSIGSVCPSYLTVTLKLFPTAYVPPVTPLIILKLLPCPYTPPLV